jgi:HAMP domain-containing protein
VLLAMLFMAVAAGAYPVVRSITGRLERLKHGVEAFGAGALAQRVQEEGKDEVAALAASFNRAAQRIQSLVQSNQSLLANASHELRSPLARLKMALSMMDDAAPAQRAALRKEIEVNIRELDALVEEVLLSSRLEAGVAVDLDDPVDALAVMAEEASRVDAQVEGPPLMLRGSERLLRRAVRNLLENARRYGGQDVQAELALQPRRGRAAGLRPRPGCARGRTRADLRALLPHARPCRARGRRGPGAGAGPPDRPAPRRPRALRAPGGRRQLLRADPAGGSSARPPGGAPSQHPALQGGQPGAGGQQAQRGGGPEARGALQRGGHRPGDIEGQQVATPSPTPQSDTA